MAAAASNPMKERWPIERNNNFTSGRMQSFWWISMHFLSRHIATMIACPPTQPPYILASLSNETWIMNETKIAKNSIVIHHSPIMKLKDDRVCFHFFKCTKRQMLNTIHTIFNSLPSDRDDPDGFPSAELLTRYFLKYESNLEKKVRSICRCKRFCRYRKYHDCFFWGYFDWRNYRRST